MEKTVSRLHAGCDNLDGPGVCSLHKSEKPKKFRFRTRIIEVGMVPFFLLGIHSVDSNLPIIIGE